MAQRNYYDSSSSGDGDDDDDGGSEGTRRDQRSDEVDPNETGEAEDRSGLIEMHPTEEECEKILGGLCRILLLAIAMTCVLVCLLLVASLFVRSKVQLSPG